MKQDTTLNSPQMKQKLNLTIMCSDGKSVKANKHQLFEASQVFYDIAIVTSEKGEESCKVEVDSKCVELGVKMLNGKHPTKTLGNLKDLFIFGKTYRIWDMEKAARKEIEDYVKTNARTLVEFAAEIDHAKLAIACLQKLISSSEPLNDFKVDEKWKLRIDAYISGLRSAALLRLYEATNVKPVGRKCAACTPLQSYFTAELFKLICQNPTFKADDILKAHKCLAAPPQCHYCGSTLNWSSERWDASLKATQAALEAAF